MDDCKQPQLTRPEAADPLASQIGGGHYKTKAIQPVEYVHANGLGFIEGSVIKYVTRWRDKGGFSDLEKAKHFIELLIQLEQRRNALSLTTDGPSLSSC